MSKLHEGEQRLEHIRGCSVCQFRINAVLKGMKISTAIRQSRKLYGLDIKSEKSRAGDFVATTPD